MSVEQPYISDGWIFARYAGNSLEKWLNLVGEKITHTSLGEGAVTQVTQRSIGWIYVSAEFGVSLELKKEFPASVFVGTSNFFRVPLPLSEADRQRLHEEIQKEEQHKIENTRRIERLKSESEQQRRQEQQRKQEEREHQEAQKRAKREEEERIAREYARIKQERNGQEYAAREAQRQRESEATSHFADLKAKYSAECYRNSSPSSRLYVILQKFDSNEAISDEELIWLEKNEVWAPLAIFYERDFARRNDPQSCIKSSSYWRKADQPQKALSVTESLLSKDMLSRYLKAAILTTRGGAYRDLGDLTKAEHHGLRAIQYNQGSFYPYSLMGAVYYQMGQPKKGDDYLSMAVERGAQSRNQDFERRHALDRANEDEQIIVANYLLQKDPQRFAWAGYYLPAS